MVVVKALLVPSCKYKHYETYRQHLAIAHKIDIMRGNFVMKHACPKVAIQNIQHSTIIF